MFRWLHEHVFSYKAIDQPRSDRWTYNVVSACVLFSVAMGYVLINIHIP